jgi:hypothetical protein
MEISSLVGLVLSEVVEENDEIDIKSTCGRSFRMYHSQECCESVYIEDVCGDLSDLVGSPILVAEESTSSEQVPDTSLMTPAMKEHHLESILENKTQKIKDYDDESCTWTFYKIDTLKGGVTIRWYGSSNGYYSEEIDFEETT